MSVEIINPGATYAGAPLQVGETKIFDPTTESRLVSSGYAKYKGDVVSLLSLNGVIQTSDGKSLLTVAVDKLTGGIEIAKVTAGLSAARLAAAPLAADIALGDSTIFYDISDPAKRYTMSADHSVFTPMSGAVALSPVAGSATRVKGSAIGNHLLIQSDTADSGTRMYIEPNGHPVGLASKLDFMFDPYEIDNANYRIFNFNAFNFDRANTSTAQGNNGVALLGAKSVGAHWGVWPTVHFGYSDDGAASAVPMKLYYFDTSDSAWRAPMVGGWRTGMSVNTGDYCTANSKIYQSQTTAITGATIPSHAAGTVSDGAVDWLFIRDVAAAASSIRGCVVFGDRDDLPKFGFPGVRAQYSQDYACWNGKGMLMLDNTGAQAWKLYGRGGTAECWLESDTSHYLRFSKTGNFAQFNGIAVVFVGSAPTDGATTYSVSGVNTVNFANTGATNFTQFTSGTAFQIFTVQSANANTTLVHGTNLKLLGGVNKTIGVDDVLMFQFNVAGTVAKQIT